ncbi:PREDICTED: uncharacterized protein LOC108764431 [Trachymyrmex cornetzi]|nr:PREDICTED: uncharacterized protein LOC108764431 [Trachymyrmex cornetzi]
MIIMKQIILFPDLQYKVLFLGKEVLSYQHILQNLDDINLLIEHAHSTTLCQGGPGIEEPRFKEIHPLCSTKDFITSTWRHKKCPLETSGEQICKFCVSLHKTLQRNVDRKKHQKSTGKIILTSTTKKRVTALRAAKHVKVQALQRRKLKENAVKDTIKHRQLDGFIETLQWKCDDIIEEDYELTPVLDRMIYYVSDFIAKKMIKRTDCSTCKTAFIQLANSTPEAELVNLKSQGRPIHPNHMLYALFQTTEYYFRKNLHVFNIYEQTIDDVINNYIITFPCNDHKLDVTSYCIYYYVTMRMRQYSRQINNDLPKKTCKRKKQARLYDT